MEQSIKQRIVGIAVLVIAAVVLLPVLFDGDGSYPLPLESRIPAPTPFPDAPRAMPQRPVITADTSAINIATNPTLEAASDPDTAEEAVAPEAPSPVSSSATASAGSTPVSASVPEPASAPESASTPEPQPSSAPAAAPEPVPAAAPGAGTALDNTGLPQGWSVRLATFSNQTNARNLMERLQSSGHRAYTRQVSSAQGSLTAVFVGPDVDRAAAQRLQAQLQRDFELAGLVVRYEIEEL